MSEFQVTGLCGSLRVASYNRAALDAARQLMPAGMVLQVEPFAQFPIYDADEQERGSFTSWRREYC